VVLVVKAIDSRKRVLLCINAALEKKAKNLAAMNVKEISAFTDYFVICSGGLDRQVQAIASAIRENMKKKGFLPLGVEGEKHGQWVLMDYGDVVVHIFYEPVREFYEIERLWSDAPRMEVDENATKLRALVKGI
jgi:ribosome-associated protein